jgi:hypothetical protein
MARPKGGTLTRLFEVSDRERQEFYEKIHKKIQPASIVSGIPEIGIPQLSTPETGAPNTGIPDIGVPEPDTHDAVTSSSSSPSLFHDEAYRSAAYISGVPFSGIPISGVPEGGVPPEGIWAAQPTAARPKIRRAVQVQDGHSLGEQLVLTTLWNNASAVEGQSYRRITIGYRTLSGMCGLTVNNCKANLKSLQTKLAIDPESWYSSTTGTTYRVLSFAEILRRREAAGLTHVIRTKGSQFVNPETGIPVTGTPALPNPGTPNIERGIPASGEKGVPAPGTQLRRKKEENPKELMAADVVVVSTAIRKHLTIDDAAVVQIMTNCRQQDPHATSEEIAHFAQLKIQQHRKNPSVQNLPGLLIRSVQEYFRLGSGELAHFRTAKAREAAKGREVAQQILDDPEATDADRAWAQEVLSSK